MNIANVHIKNLRSIEELELVLTAPDGLPRRRLVLLGGNGCGKTTTLLAIAHVLGQADNDFGAKRMGAGDVRQPIGSESSPSPTLPLLAGGAIEIQVGLSQEDRVLWDQYAPKQEPPEHGTLQASIGGSLRDAELQPLLDKSRSPYQGVNFFGHAYEALLSQLDQSPGAEPERTNLAIEGVIRTLIARRPHPPGVLLPADRGTLQEFEDIPLGSLSAFDPRVNCLSNKRERFQVVPALLALAFMAPEVNDRDRMVARMWKVLAKYFPEMPQPYGVRGLRLLFKTPEGVVVDLPRLSDGQRAVLLILGELALRNPAGGVVLIDELEQHLHPRWQRAILDALVALLPDAQFIITTQAPYLATAAPDDVVKIGDWGRDGPRE